MTKNTFCQTLEGSSLLNLIGEGGGSGSGSTGPQGPRGDPGIPGSTGPQGDPGIPGGEIARVNLNSYTDQNNPYELQTGVSCYFFTSYSSNPVYIRLPAAVLEGSVIFFAFLRENIGTINVLDEDSEPFHTFPENFFNGAYCKNGQASWILHP